MYKISKKGIRSKRTQMSKFRMPKINSIHYHERYLSKDIPFDPDKQIAVIKCSICTGEQVAGFKSKEGGHFTEVMLIREDKDLARFKEKYKITEIKKEY